MGSSTGIGWTDASWPIINGCRRCSPGCEACYAEGLIATRLSKQPKYAGLAIYGKNGPRWTGESRLWAPHLDWPFGWKRARRIFVADMGDLFYEEVSNEEIAAVFGVMAACPQHTFQALTKRPARMLEWFAWAAQAASPPAAMCAWSARAYFLNAGLSVPAAVDALADSRDLLPWPLPNVSLGVSVESQRYADERIPLLLDAPAGSVRFLSVEPQLEQVILSDAFLALGKRGWCIQGGESGRKARAFDVAWARSMRAQCHDARVPYFLKQIGARPLDSCNASWVPTFLQGKGEEPEDWPTELRHETRQFPEARS